MLDLTPFQNLPLQGGFLLVETHLTAKPLLDPIKRAAVAQTRITGNRFWILLRADLDESELSISLFHEVLEAATVAHLSPPKSVVDFNEGDFEREAKNALEKFGIATPRTLNQMLAEFGF